MPFILQQLSLCAGKSRAFSWQVTTSGARRCAPSRNCSVERGWPNLGVDILIGSWKPLHAGLDTATPRPISRLLSKMGTLVWEPRVRRREWRPGVRLRMAAKKGPKMVDLKCKTNLSQSNARLELSRSSTSRLLDVRHYRAGAFTGKASHWPRIVAILATI